MNPERFNKPLVVWQKTPIAAELSRKCDRKKAVATIEHSYSLVLAVCRDWGDHLYQEITRDPPSVFAVDTSNSCETLHGQILRICYRKSIALCRIASLNALLEPANSLG
jgi:hypothetical protein